MFLEAIAAVSLHCSVAESLVYQPGTRPGETTGPSYSAQLYVDYDRPYGYLKIDHPEAPGHIETTSVLVTDTRIRFLAGSFGMNRLNDAVVDRTTGVFTLEIMTPVRATGTRLPLRGTCTPGEPIELPERAAPLF